MKNKHLRFLVGLLIIPIMNFFDYLTPEYVFIRITYRQWWVMVYKDMNRIEAANYIKKR